MQKAFPTELQGKWLDQMLAEQASWFEATGTKATDEELKAYQAGYRAAWNGAFAMLALHKYIKRS